MDHRRLRPLLCALHDKNPVSAVVSSLVSLFWFAFHIVLALSYSSTQKFPHIMGPAAITVLLTFIATVLSVPYRSNYVPGDSMMGLGAYGGYGGGMGSPYGMAYPGMFGMSPYGMAGMPGMGAMGMGGAYGSPFSPGGLYGGGLGGMGSPVGMGLGTNSFFKK